MRGVTRPRNGKFSQAPRRLPRFGSAKRYSKWDRQSAHFDDRGLRSPRKIRLEATCGTAARSAVADRVLDQFVFR
jgi:hypothetical protein